MAKEMKKPAHRVVLRPLSGVVYFYPTFFAAIVCGIVQSVSPNSPADPGPIGTIFTLIFFFNLTVVAFDYTRLASVVIILIFVILGLVSAMFPGFSEFIQNAMAQPMFMNETFYFVWAGGLGLVLAGILIKTRFDYFEVKNNELLHHHGLLGDVERWPAPNMRISKEINDVMEYLLCRSGRMVLLPSRAERAIVLDNVPGITKKEKRMQELLNVWRVDEVDE